MRKKIISVILLMVLASALVPSMAVNAAFSDVYDISLGIRMENGIAYGTANAEKLAGTSGESYPVELVLAFYTGQGVLCGVSNERFTLSEDEDSFTLSSAVPDTAATVRVFAFNSLAAPFPLCASVSQSTRKSMKILAIGNSFSEDALYYLYEIARTAGYEDVTLGNLYIGSCTLDTHFANITGNRAEYKYQKNVSGTKTETPSTTMLEGIEDEDWDIITLQQGSGSSGLPETYGHLEDLITYIHEHKTNPDAKLGWHLTWAYEGDSTHQDFANYDNDQMTMYHAIIDTVRQEVLPLDAFDFIIPSGTAIQNSRTSFVGDTLTHDGFHLSRPYGRYIAGLTWLETLTGIDAETIDWYPAEDVDLVRLEAAYEAVSNACDNPYAVTQSSYEEYPQFDFSDYTQLELELTTYAFWNSERYVGLDKGNDDWHAQFIATQKFTRDDLPIGTIIVIDSGWQYRPDGWQTEDALNTSGRPGNVSENMVTVTEDWWGDFQYRAFNISTTSGADISERVDEARQHFKIYIPKA